MLPNIAWALGILLNDLEQISSASIYLPYYRKRVATSFTAIIIIRQQKTTEVVQAKNIHYLFKQFVTGYISIRLNSLLFYLLLLLALHYRLVFGEIGFCLLHDILSFETLHSI